MCGINNALMGKWYRWGKTKKCYTFHNPILKSFFYTLLFLILNGINNDFNSCLCNDSVVCNHDNE